MQPIGKMLGGTVISSVEEEDGDRARLAPTSGTSNTIEVILTMTARRAFTRPREAARP